MFLGTLTSDTPSAMREEVVDRLLLPLAAQVFKKRPEVNSVLLAIAQYWNDEADDAVHASVHYSRRHTPIWPHECDDFSEEEAPSRSTRTDFCRWCSGDPSPFSDDSERLPWDSNGSAIQAFQAFCREGCHQEMNRVEAYLPFAVVRRGAGCEIVGRPVRPWVERPTAMAHEARSAGLAELLAAVYRTPEDDGPRSVLADFLLERSDPIGELIAIQLRKADASGVQLSPEQLREWIGPIHHVMASTGAVFRRGFLAEADVFFTSAEEIARYGSDPGWATVERIHFLEGSLQHLDPSMRGLQVVSGLGDDALVEAATSSHAWPVRDLSVRLDEHTTFAHLEASTSLSALRRFELHGEAVRHSEVVQLLRSPAAARLARLAVANVDLPAVPAWLDALERFTTLSAFETNHRLDAGRRAGWTISFERGQDGRLSILRARLDNLAGDGRVERVCHLLEALPREALTQVLLERTDCFDPRVEDEVQLREAAKSQRRLLGVEVVG